MKRSKKSENSSIVYKLGRQCHWRNYEYDIDYLLIYYNSQFIINKLLRSGKNTSSFHQHSSMHLGLNTINTWIIKLSTVVRSWKYCHHLSLCKEFISIFNNLMSSTNKVNVIVLKEFSTDIRSKYIWNTSFILYNRYSK